jgi:hypothetical protein
MEYQINASSGFRNALENFYQFLAETCQELKIDRIVTNGNIASTLQDYQQVQLKEKEISKPTHSKPTRNNPSYQIGFYQFGVSLWVNALIPWNEKDIFLYQGEELIKKLEVVDDEDVLI